MLTDMDGLGCTGNKLAKIHGHTQRHKGGRHANRLVYSLKVAEIKMTINPYIEAGSRR